jgi:eukaryotic-like serine/threonine-protein kinase
MMLSAGARLGPYEILAPLGAGGMGEVYRARDTRLDRTVALKVLPADVASDVDRHERFRREARAISRLSHPHICTLHDIGEQDGVDFLVMEYLAGETLAHRLLRGSLPLDDVLRIGVELASGLEAAHREGVTHRDLKPANIMLTPGGAKILDFGLAKWTQPREGADPNALAVTDPSLTQSGIVLGTVQYMAPEQADGKPADGRADLFALGAILYEMTTGRRAFAGTSPSSILAAVLTTSPPPMAELQPLTPPAFERTVKKCLAKDPAKRWQTAADLCDELAWVADEHAEHGSPQIGATASVTLRPWKRMPWFAIAATALLAMASIRLAVVHLREVPTAATSVRLLLPPPEGATYASWSFIESVPAASPDGRHVAFVAHRKGEADLVWLRALDGLAASALPGTENASSHSAAFWSPDSQSLGFFAEGKLKRIEINGGPPQLLADAPDGRGGTWNEQGVIVFAPAADGPLYRVSATGGRATPATRLEPSESGHRWPVFLPDGRRFIFHSRSAPDYEKSGTDLGSLDSLETTRLLTSAITFNNVAYAPTGHLLFARQQALFAQPFDAERGVFSGSPQSIADDVAIDAGIGAAFSISANGLLVYRPAPKPVSSRLEWFDRAGRPQGTIGEPAEQDEPLLAPDGTRVAVTRGPEVWLLTAETGTASRFTFDGTQGHGSYSPVWSPDGRWIAFGVQQHSVAGKPGFVGLLRRAANGTGEAERLATMRYSVVPTDWSRDGRFIIYADQDPVTKVDLWALPLAGDRKPLPLVRTPGDDAFGELSPNGAGSPIVPMSADVGRCTSSPFRQRAANGRSRPTAAENLDGDAMATSCSISPETSA